MNRCINCAGTGSVRDESRPVRDASRLTYPHSKLCPFCNGTGQVPDTATLSESPQKAAKAASGCLVFLVFVGFSSAAAAVMLLRVLV